MKFSIFFSGFLLLLAGLSFAVPTVVINSPANTTYYNRSILLNTTVAGNVSAPSCAYSLNSWANNTTFNCSFTYMNASNGTSTVLVRANDTSGINNTESVSFSVTYTIMNYTIPTPNTTVSNPYVYDASANLTSLGYSIPATAVWVQNAYVYDAGANVSVLSYPVPDTSLWVQNAYFYNNTTGVSQASYPVSGTALWVRNAYFYNATTGTTTVLYPIPLTWLTVVIRNTTYCASGNDCAGIGNLCINGTCRGLTAGGSDLGAKCSVDATNYNLTGYTWASAGCTIPVQLKYLTTGMRYFDFPNIKAGYHHFVIYTETDGIDSVNASHGYITLYPTNLSNPFVNVEIVVNVSGPGRNIRGEALE